MGAVIAVAIGGATGAAPQTQAPTFRARRDMVRLDVSVTDRGKPITGLQAGDFTVVDNGVAQKVEYLSFDELALNIVLAFDASGSVAGPRAADLRAAGHAVLAELRGDDRAAFVSFSHAVSLGSDLTTDRASVRRAIDASGATGLTSIVDAAFTGLTLGASDAGRSLMLVFSDGVDTSSWLEPKTVIDAAKRSNVVVFGVTTAKSRDPFLKDLAEATAGDLAEVQKTSELRSAFVKLLAEYRLRYIVGYSPTGVTSGGWHKVQVSVARRNAAIKARDGYQDR
jgi:VWFA-related protein